MSSDSVRIPVSVGAWTDVTDGVKKGFITNFSQHRMRYRTANIQPDSGDLWGHEINPQEKRYFDLDDNFKVWALGFYHDAVISLTKDYDAAVLTSSVVTFDQHGQTTDANGRLRVSRPATILEDKHITSPNKPRWNDLISGLILDYGTLVGGPFTPGEEIRGTIIDPLNEVIPIGIINTDNGVDSMNIDCNVNYFEIGQTITGQTSGATAVITVQSGSDIQWNYDVSGIDLTCGTGATDFAIRQSFRRSIYVIERAELISNAYLMAPPQANQVQRVGIFDESDGFFLQRTITEVSFVVRSSVSGSPVDTPYPQSQWNLDKFDGGASDGPNPSGITLDLDTVQSQIIDFTWSSGVAYLAFYMNNEQLYANQIFTANTETSPIFRTPTIPLRFEISNTGATAAPATLTAFSSSTSSEAGTLTPGLDFSAASELVPRTIAQGDGLVPIFALRMKNNFKGFPNRRALQIEGIELFVDQNIYAILRHVHSPIDIVATWQDVSPESAAEYSIDITAVTGRPSAQISQKYLGIGKNSTVSANAQDSFINIHSVISQSYDFTNSDMFVVYAIPFGNPNAEVYTAIDWVEFE